MSKNCEKASSPVVTASKNKKKDPQKNTENQQMICFFAKLNI